MRQKLFGLLAGLLSFSPTTLIAESTTAPSTVSDEARAFIDGNKVHKLDPQSIDEWQELAGTLAPNGQLSDPGEALLKEIQLTLKLVTIDGAEHLMITPDNLDPSYERRLVIYAHGGAYTMGRPEDQIASAGMIAHQMRQRVLAIRYPLAWMEPFPAARDRLVAVYKEMLKSHSPQHIALSGDSAGGGLVLSSVLAIRDSGMPMPAALGLISPWADISKTGDSMTIQDGHDPLISYDNNLAVSALLYANGLSLTDPGVSPIYGDYTKGFPPTYISTGTRDLFLSHAARLQRKLTDAGVANSLYVYEGMWHVFQLAPEPAVPEVASAWRDYARFLDGHMAR